MTDWGHVGDLQACRSVLDELLLCSKRSPRKGLQNASCRRSSAGKPLQWAIWSDPISSLTPRNLLHIGKPASTPRKAHFAKSSLTILRLIDISQVVPHVDIM